MDTRAIHIDGKVYFALWVDDLEDLLTTPQQRKLCQFRGDAHITLHRAEMPMHTAERFKERLQLKIEQIKDRPFHFGAQCLYQPEHSNDHRMVLLVLPHTSRLYETCHRIKNESLKECGLRATDEGFCRNTFHISLGVTANNSGAMSSTGARSSTGAAPMHTRPRPM